MRGLAAALLAFLIAWSGVPVAERIARRIGAMDIPSDWRRMHKRSIPRGGGIAILASVALAWLILCPYTSLMTASLAGVLLIFAVGLADDVYRLDAFFKLTVQLFAATVSVIGSGLFDGIAVLGGILWVVALCNAHNFVDGLDGLFGGTAAIEGICLTAVLILLGMWDFASLPLAVSFACLGFLRYNRPPARIFAGDCGSGSAGFLLGMVSLPCFSSIDWELGLLAPLMIFAYPLTDLFTAVLRRLLRGVSPFDADRAHLHHRIIATGIGVGRCTVLLHLLCASLGAVGILLVRRESIIGALIATLATILLMVSIRRFLLHFAKNG